VLERRRQKAFPGGVDYVLGTAGSDLLSVAELIQDWLAYSPAGPIQLGTVSAKSTVEALLEGWSSMIIQALAGRPLSLTDLNGLISSVNYPSLERRLAALRVAGLVEAMPMVGRTTPYEVSEWLREAVGPLTVAIQWERRRVAERTTPISKLDAESIFLLAVPLMKLPIDVSGRCRLVIEIRGSSGAHHVAGALIGVKEGRVVACTSQLQGGAEAWATGSSSAWLSALIEQKSAQLEVGGDSGFARAVLDGLSEILFGCRRRD
jgi:DNA-binding HxlR family transcriptional regulator